MLRGWLLRSSSCAAAPNSARVSHLTSPRSLLSTWNTRGSGSAHLHQHQQQQHSIVFNHRRPDVSCMAAAAAAAGGSGGGLEIGRRYSKPANYQPATSFDQLKLNDKLLEALAAANLDKPTEIQSLAIPAILQGGDYLLAAQTGSGKTLAYLLPLISALKAQEGQPGMERRGRRPKIVVLVPTKELVEQITAVAKSLCHYAKFRVVPCSANYSETVQNRSLTPPLEMLVATPTRLQAALEDGKVALGDVRWLVVDEADTMLEAGKGFQAEVRHLVDILRNKAQHPAQTILVSATMTKAVKQLVSAFLPDLQRIEAAGFHRPAAGASHDFRPLTPGGDKMQQLLEVLQSDVAKGRKVLVFCNSMDSCRAVEHTCRERDMPTVCYHGDMPIQARKDAMVQFAGNYAAGDAGDAAADASATVMVATDLAARGLDFPGTIDHVINFDMPNNAIDYLHRAGRTARAGAKGRVTSLLQSRQDRNMGKAIQYALDNNIGLDLVTTSGGAGGPRQLASQSKQQQQQAGPPSSSTNRGRQQQQQQQSGRTNKLAASPRWNPNHKFIHLKDGKPIVPFEVVLRGKTGEERRRLMNEIAVDVQEWRRWRSAQAAERAEQRRRKEEQQQQKRFEGRRGGGSSSSGGSGSNSKPATPEEAWKQRLAQKRQAAAAAKKGGGGARGGAAGAWDKRGSGGSKQQGSKRLFK